MDSSAPQSLVRIDVPHAGDCSLVENRRLDGSSTPTQALGKVLRPVRLGERLSPDAGIDVGVDLVRLEQQPRSEAADIAIADVRSVV